MTVVVAHRAGNHPETARAALGRADAIELDVHVLRGRVEVRHAKVLRPTTRLWERWYLLPKGSRGVPIGDVLEAIPPDTPLLLDLKCFTPRAARRIERSVPASHPVVASSRSWWLLRVFRARPGALVLRSCGTRWQLDLATRLPGLGAEVGIVAHQRLLDQEAIRSVIAVTPELYTWAVETAGRALELTSSGATGLIVDDLDVDWPGGR